MLDRQTSGTHASLRSDRAVHLVEGGDRSGKVGVVGLSTKPNRGGPRQDQDLKLMA